MQIIKNTKGRAKGKICVTATLDSMEVGETWMANTNVVDYNYLTTACSQATKKSGKVFSTSNTAELKKVIIVTRIR